MVNSNTDKVREVERRVVDIYTKSDTSNKDVVCSIQSLMMMRWNMMHHGIMWDNEFVAKLDAMNEQMKQALIAMRYKTLDVYEYLKLRCPGGYEVGSNG